VANIQNVLKDEITRLSKKVLKQQLQSHRKAASAQRKQIAALRREVAALQRALSALKRGTRVREANAPAEEADAPLRFQVRGLKSLRAKLGLSAADMGKLIGATGQSVYNWESGKTTPRRAQVRSIAGLRSIGKKEAAARLGALQG
jgi:DNA-binding XRE family transcriptional regulator